MSLAKERRGEGGIESITRPFCTHQHPVDVVVAIELRRCEGWLVEAARVLSVRARVTH